MFLLRVLCRTKGFLAVAKLLLKMAETVSVFVICCHDPTVVVFISYFTVRLYLYDFMSWFIPETNKTYSLILYSHDPSKKL